jgi:hypothetical protein
MADPAEAIFAKRDAGSSVLIGHRPRGEHQHPLVRITFKEPRSAEAAVFASLLGQSEKTVE